MPFQEFLILIFVKLSEEAWKLWISPKKDDKKARCAVLTKIGNHLDVIKKTDPQILALDLGGYRNCPITAEGSFVQNSTLRLGYGTSAAIAPDSIENF
jgi:hypothetical protein